MTLPSPIEQSEAPHDGVCDGLEAGTGGGDVVPLLHPGGQVRLPAQSPGVQCGAGALDITQVAGLVVPRLDHRIAALLLVALLSYLPRHPSIHLDGKFKDHTRSPSASQPGQQVEQRVLPDLMIRPVWRGATEAAAHIP